MRTRVWCMSLVLAGLGVACGDQPTEVVPERADDARGGDDRRRDVILGRWAFDHHGQGRLLARRHRMVHRGGVASERHAGHPARGRAGDARAAYVVGAGGGGWRVSRFDICGGRQRHRRDLHLNSDQSCDGSLADGAVHGWQCQGDCRAQTVSSSWSLARCSPRRTAAGRSAGPQYFHDRSRNKHHCCLCWRLRPAVGTACGRRDLGGRSSFVSWARAKPFTVDPSDNKSICLNGDNGNLDFTATYNATPDLVIVSKATHWRLRGRQLECSIHLRGVEPGYRHRPG